MSREDTKVNPLFFPLLMISLAFVMYFIAFHSTRNENDDLKKEIIELKAKIKL
jgi:hypothetical protein